jgi:natural product precursor
MNSNRKLQLNRETVRTLSTQEMSAVAGGAVLQYRTGACAMQFFLKASPKLMVTNR